MTQNDRNHPLGAPASEARRAEQEREATVEFLRLANATPGTVDLVHAAVAFFQERSGCEAVGIRLRDGEDFPYFESRGFPERFLRLENTLCTHDPAGELVRDSFGHACLECLCGKVICGRFDPAQPFFTAHGSFWTNSTTELLASTTEADRQTRTRNRCHGEGYESVALIALHVGEEHPGLLQLNDQRRGRFSPELIALWERLAGYLAVALARTRGEEGLRQAKEGLALAVRKAAQTEIQRHVQELRAANDELTRFNAAMVHRELRMIELKQEVNALCAAAGQPPRYALELDPGSGR